jgi:hypothetical protein
MDLARKSTSVTELALLRVPLGQGAADDIAGQSAAATTEATRHHAIPATILDGLHRAKQAMEKASAEKFAWYLLHPQDTQPALEHDGIESHRDKCTGPPRAGSGTEAQILLIGGWPSVAFHFENWIPSPENQALLAELGTMNVQTKWMWHVDVERGDVEGVLRRPITAGGQPSSGQNSVLRFWRGVFPDSAAKSHAETLLNGLEGVVDRDRLIWAWRLDDGYWAEQEIDPRASAGVDAAELIVLAGFENDELLDQVLVDLNRLAVHVNDRRGVVLDVE